jgi:hypothetical protein
MKYYSYGRVFGYLVGVSGVLVAAMFAAVAALAVEASSQVYPGQQCWRLQRRRRWKRRLQSATAPVSAAVSSAEAEAFALVVSAAAVGTMFMVVCFVVLMQDSVFMVEIQQGALRN